MMSVIVDDDDRRAPSGTHVRAAGTSNNHLQELGILRIVSVTIGTSNVAVVCPGAISTSPNPYT